MQQIQVFAPSESFCIVLATIKRLVRFDQIKESSNFKIRFMHGFNQLKAENGTSTMISIVPIVILLLLASKLAAQPPIPFQFSHDDFLHFTSEYSGERFADGRPKVSKDILDRMKLVTIEEAWGVLRDHGYENQFDQGWVMTHDNPVLVGRAATCSFLPLRPDVANVIVEDGAKNNYQGRDKHWVMDLLVEDDVIVVDLFGKKLGAGFVGDNLANLIQQKTGTGMVVDGGCRDLAGVLELPNFYVFNRNWHPSTSSAYDKSMVIGMNLPIRIGEAVVIPGDVVLGLRRGCHIYPRPSGSGSCRNFRSGAIKR
ncbi:MAG: RraA family protein [Saprospiraceae bacterium]|nr:RraA family protein [Saprospiraceae bacterium]